MAQSTKKVGSAGRFGARYGGLARKKIASIEAVQRANHVCPSCGHEKLKRAGTGIWNCRKCAHTFAGGAYVPQTGAGRGASKALRGINEKLIRGEATEGAFQEALAAAKAEEEAGKLSYEAVEEEEPEDVEAGEDIDEALAEEEEGVEDADLDEEEGVA